MKVADRDLYVEWSTVVDDVITWGTRSELKDVGIDVERLDRAEKYGSSSHIGAGQWDSDGLVVAQRGWLPRGRLGAYLDVRQLQYIEDKFDDDDPRILVLLDELD